VVMPQIEHQIDWKKDLNKGQLEAVVNTEGPLLVLAGAGSGKTRVITYRLAYLHLEKKIEPWRCLALTFTNKAAGEMQARAESICGGGARFPIFTFHSFCARWLRRNAQRIELSRDFVILDSGDVRSLLTAILKEKNLPRDLYPPRDLASAISYAKNHMMSHDDFSGERNVGKQQVMKEVYAAFEKRKQELAALDFDDLLLRVIRSLEEDEELLKETAGQYSHILVDEYQDTNMPQDRILELLARAHGNICVVGDDDQLIYRWRGAMPENILEFDKRWPGARIIRLEENYRSTENILAAANALVKKNEARHGKELFTRKGEGEKVAIFSAEDGRSEAEAVVNLIAGLIEKDGYKHGDIAVFYRTNAQSRPLEERFLQRGMPYQLLGGMRFYERKEIKDILAYLRLLHNPADDLAFHRVVNLPRRGIGSTTIARLVEVAQERGMGLYATATELVKEKGRSHRTLKAMGDFIDLIEGLKKEQGNIPLPNFIEYLTRKIGYLDYLKNTEGDLVQGKLENLEQLQAAAVELIRDADGNSPIKEQLAIFLERVVLLSDADSLQANTDSVLLMTVHTAKGLEFPVVFVTGMEEGLFPHALNTKEKSRLEEERRLFYVAITRAQKRLFLSYALVRFTHGTITAQQPSSFLPELPRDLLESIEPPGASSSPRGATILPSSGKDTRLGFNSDGPYRRKPTGSQARGMLRVGDLVHHRTFGEGRIVDLSGAGDNLKATVDFMRHGRKTVVQKYAKLTKHA
jgi:ATP-dependent DNA helicase UvrD/PcrA